MKTVEIKTIDVCTKTWFDKVNGNTYFAQAITLNFGMNNSETLINPFQYGYGSYDIEAFRCIEKNVADFKFLSYAKFQESGIILRQSVKECLKRELKNI